MSDAIDLIQFKQRLLELRTEINGLVELVEGAIQPVELDQNRVGRLSRMDAIQGQAMAQASAARQQQQLANIGAALERIERGDYGRCLECDKPIASARLMMDPTVELCIVCAAASEAS